MSYSQDIIPSFFAASEPLRLEFIAAIGEVVKRTPEDAYGFHDFLINAFMMGSPEIKTAAIEIMDTCAQQSQTFAGTVFDVMCLVIPHGGPPRGPGPEGCRKYRRPPSAF
jgi:hypothetical protein